MAKRSPILGYNHNVRYRGLIFHVQTEDSGVLSPHLFTHLFHAGVIVSTRKLVYDAGSDEGAIKSLMQAQHKAVMKDLKKGTFDEKIDQYLGGTPGLLPRGAAAGDEAQPPERESQPALAQASSPAIAAPESTPVAQMSPPSEIDATVRNLPAVQMPGVDATIKTPAIDIAALHGSTPEEINNTLRGTTPARATTESRVARPIGPPPLGEHELDEDLGLTRPSRTRTAERGSAPSAVRTSLPPPPSSDLDGPTTLDAGVNATIRTPVVPSEAGTSDSMNAIIALELEDERSSARIRRDTDIQAISDSEPSSDGVPGVVGAASDVSRPRSQAESVQPLPPPPASSRPASHGSLLPPRPPTRPPARPAITPPQVLSRPITSDRNPGREDSDAIEVYAPAPPSAEAPPGVAPAERPGQYSHVKRVSQKLPALDPATGRERSGGVPIPPGLGRPGNRVVNTAKPPPTPPPRDSKPVQAAPVQAMRDASSGARPRTPTPGRTTGPMASRPGSASSQPNSGVVMTRPAVIVGAPAKSAQPSRVRKAREDEGRGFGQGLISEKSLDEVILAYLSEDADEK